MADSIIEKVDQALQNEEAILAANVGKTLKGMNERPTSAAIKDYEAAKTALENYRARKQQAAAESFVSKREVIAYLIEQGYDVKPDSSKVNGDLDGVPRKDGKWTKKVIDDYAKLRLRKADGVATGGDAEAKAKEEARLTKERADKIAFENEIMRGKYILRSEVERQFAARAAFLKDGVGARFIHSRAPRIVELVGGDMAKVPDLVEVWLREVEELFDHYARPVEFEAVDVNTEDRAEEM